MGELVSCHSKSLKLAKCHPKISFLSNATLKSIYLVNYHTYNYIFEIYFLYYPICPSTLYLSLSPSISQLDTWMFQIKATSTSYQLSYMTMNFFISLVPPYSLLKWTSALVSETQPRLMSNTSEKRRVNSVDAGINKRRFLLLHIDFQILHKRHHRAIVKPRNLIKQ
jgi:hypothetical protein